MNVRSKDEQFIAEPPAEQLILDEKTERRSTFTMNMESNIHHGEERVLKPVVIQHYKDSNASSSNYQSSSGNCHLRYSDEDYLRQSAYFNKRLAYSPAYLQGNFRRHDSRNGFHPQCDLSTRHINRNAKKSNLRTQTAPVYITRSSSDNESGSTNKCVNLDTNCMESPGQVQATHIKAKKKSQAASKGHYSTSDFRFPIHIIHGRTEKKGFSEFNGQPGPTLIQTTSQGAGSKLYGPDGTYYTHHPAHEGLKWDKRYSSSQSAQSGMTGTFYVSDGKCQYHVKSSPYNQWNNRYCIIITVLILLSCLLIWIPLTILGIFLVTNQ